MNGIRMAAAALLLSGASSMALASPTEMTQAQMDKITAGTASWCCDGTNFALVDLLDLNHALASAENFLLLAGGAEQSAQAGNLQINYSVNYIRQ